MATPGTLQARDRLASAHRLRACVRSQLISGRSGHGRRWQHRSLTFHAKVGGGSGALGSPARDLTERVPYRIVQT